MQKAQCENCSAIHTVDEIVPLHDVKNLFSRIEPGELLPAGECPACQALAFLIAETPTRSGKTRPIEMFFGFQEGNAKAWDTDYVEIPIETADADINTVASEAFLKMAQKWEDTLIAFCGVYCIVDPEEYRGNDYGDDE